MKFIDKPATNRRRAAIFLLAAGLLVLCRATVVDWHRVTGHSMAPTLRPGDWIVCNKLAYGLRLPGARRYLIQWSAPRAGEIVIFTSPHDGRRCIKRVAPPPTALAPLPGGEVWLLGDNPQRSFDSRRHGPVGLPLIEGRALFGT